jgi:hypothetical protein
VVGDISLVTVGFITLVLGVLGQKRGSMNDSIALAGTTYLPTHGNRGYDSFNYKLLDADAGGKKAHQRYRVVGRPATGRTSSFLRHKPMKK